LVDDTNGNWWAVMLARREFGPSYPLGRETFMVPVKWPRGEFPQFEPVELNQPVSEHNISSKTSFPTDHQVTISSPHTLYLRDPKLQDYKQGHDSKTLILHLVEEELGTVGGNPTFIGQRQISLDSDAQAEIDLISAPRKGHCGLSVYKDPFRHISLDIDLGQRQISLAVHHLGQDLSFLKATLLQDASAVRVRIQSTTEEYKFLYNTFSNSHWSTETELGQIPCANMSADDFTGMAHFYQ
jgi:beta-xylosidase